MTQEYMHRDLRDLAYKYREAWKGLFRINRTPFVQARKVGEQWQSPGRLQEQAVWRWMIAAGEEGATIKDLARDGEIEQATVRVVNATRAIAETGQDRIASAKKDLAGARLRLTPTPQDRLELDKWVISMSISTHTLKEHTGEKEWEAMRDGWRADMEKVPFWIVKQAYQEWKNEQRKSDYRNAKPNSMNISFLAENILEGVVSEINILEDFLKIYESMKSWTEQHKKGEA